MTTPAPSWRWKFTQAADTYTFERNPRTMRPTARPNSTAPGVLSPVDGRFRGDRAPARPYDWSFEGRIKTQTFYEALLLWSEKPGRIVLTDHFQKTLTLRIVAFEPVAMPTRIDNDWLFNYTMRCLVYGP